MRMLKDLIIQSPPDSSESTSMYAEKMSQKMKHSFQVANDNLQGARKVQKNQYDSFVKNMAFKCGNLVWYYERKSRRSRCDKLNRLWSGPWIVKKVLTDGTVYRISYTVNR